MKLKQFIAIYYKEIGLVLLLALPFAIFVFYTFRYAVNIPIWDDYDAVLYFLNSFMTAGSFQGKALYLFAQHNEHRIVINRLIVLAQYAISGKVDFAQLVYIGNFGYVIFVSLVIFQLKKLGLSLFQLLPVPYLLFSLTHYEIIFFATPSIQYYWSILFSFLFLVFLVDRRRIILTCLIYPVSIFTQGGGLILFPIGLAYLAFQKRWKHAAAFLVSSAIFTGIYFFRFHTIPSLPSLESSFVHFDRLIAYFFAFFGNVLLSYDIASVVGTAIVIMLLIFLIRHPEEKFLFIITSWILVVGVTIALSRNGLGLEQVLQSRYTVYSQIAIVILYAWIVRTEYLKGSLIINNISFASLVVCAALFCGVFVKFQVRDQFNWEKDIKINSLVFFAARNQEAHLIYPYISRPKEILSESLRLGVFNYKEVSLNLRQKVEIQTNIPTPNSDFLGNIDVNDGSLIRGWAIIPGAGSSTSKISLLLKNGSGIFQLRTYKIERTDVSAAQNISYLYDESGYEAYIDAYQIPDGEYQLGILVENGEKVAIQWQGARIAVP